MINALKYYHDLLFNMLDLNINLDMIAKSFPPKAWLALFGKDFHKILQLIVVNISKAIISLVDDNY